jgi:hypothetical protein
MHVQRNHGRRTSRPLRSHRTRNQHRTLRFEGLENRRVLAVFHLVADVEDGAVGSLREAVAAANQNQEDDEIHLAAGRYDLTLAGSTEDASASGDLDFTEAGKAVTIIGAGIDQSVIDAGRLSDRALEVLSGVSLTLQGVTIQNGSQVVQGGGIRNAGKLTVHDTAVSSNSSDEGGGIYNAGDLAVDNSVVQKNVADLGGGLFNFSGTATISRSTVANNTAHWSAGGIGTAAGNMEVLDSTVADNSAKFAGGIIVLAVTKGKPAGTIDPRYPWEPGKLQIRQSTVTGNYASREGGGLRTSIGSQVEIVRSTFSYNQAGTPESEPNGTGGGLDLHGLGSKVSILHSTITANAAEFGAGIAHTTYDTLEVGNSIVAGNRKLHSTIFKNHFIFKDLEAPYQSVTHVTSLGNNLIGNTDSSVTGFVHGVHGDVVGGKGNLPINPLLRPVIDDDGTTGMLAPIACSPAIAIGAGAVDFSEQDSSTLNCGGSANADWYTLSYGDFVLPITANDAENSDRVIAWMGEPSQGGKLSITADGSSVHYSPPAEYRGVETFAYAIHGSSGELEHAIVTVHVVDGLLANTDDHVTPRDSDASAVDVLSNDWRFESLLGVSPILGVTPGGAGGATEIAADGRSIMYTPPAGFVGEDTFEYTLAGGDSAKVRVRVYDPESALQAPDRQYTVMATPDGAGPPTGPVCNPDKPTCGLQDVVDGWNFPVIKHFTYESIENDLLTIDSVREPDQGGYAGVVWNLREKWIRYRPRAGFTGLETIEYVTRDMEGRTSTGTITVNVVRLEDQARIRLKATDDVGNVIDSIRAGQRFQLRVMVQDLRPDDPIVNRMSALRSGLWFLDGAKLRAVQTAAVQIGFDSKLVAVAGDTQFGAPYADSALNSYAPLARLSAKGVELAANADWVREIDGQDYTFATIPLIAKASGTIAITIEPTWGVSVFGLPGLPNYAVDYEGLSLNVISNWRNANAPEDINSDGTASPIDALLLINDLNANGSQQLKSAEGEESATNSQRPNYFPDANDDGWLTPTDALFVINRLNDLNDNTQRQAAEGEYFSGEEILEVTDSEILRAANEQPELRQLPSIVQTSSLRDRQRGTETSNQRAGEDRIAARHSEIFSTASSTRRGGDASSIRHFDKFESEAESELFTALAIDSLTAKIE